MSSHQNTGRYKTVGNETYENAAKKNEGIVVSGITELAKKLRAD
jgi:hypothetical protein